MFNAEALKTKIFVNLSFLPPGFYAEACNVVERIFQDYIDEEDAVYAENLEMNKICQAWIESH